MEFNVAVLPGDHVGPEALAETTKVLDVIAERFNHVFNWHWDDVGGASIDRYGAPLRQETIDLCRRSDAILYGATGGRKWDYPGAKVRAETTLLGIRKEFRLFANLRVVKVYPSLVDSSTLRPEVVEGVDLVIVRELTGGLYFGEPRGIEETPEGKQAINTMVYSQAEIERILRLAFELARKRSKRLTSVDKANVLENSMLWRETATALAPEFADVELRHLYVDSAAMRLVRDPRSFDVIVTENTFGDILSDEAAMLSGSLGMIPSANLAGRPDGTAFGLYEPLLHGSEAARPEKDVNNPIGSILSGALMLRYSFGLDSEATAIEDAVARVLENNRTWDIMSKGKREVGTRAMGDLIAGEVHHSV